MNMTLQWWDWVGLAGTASVLLGFFLLQAGKLHGQRIAFQLLNLFGAIGLLVSLYGKFNVSVFLMEAAWALISAYGIVRGGRGGGKSAASNV
jgi:paired small multidrug resistance pump